MQAADRVMKDKSMPPSVALNLRDLTMDRYQKHMEGKICNMLKSKALELKDRSHRQGWLLLSLGQEIAGIKAIIQEHHKPVFVSIESKSKQ